MANEVRWVTFTVTVPEWGVPELSALANDLVARAAMPPEPEPDPYSTEAVRHAYFEVPYPNWQAFLKALAHNAELVNGKPVPWTQLVNTIGVDARQLSGTLGAAQRFLNGRPPFERGRGNGQTSTFIMRPDVAAMIIKFANDSTDESLRMASE